MSGVPYYGYEIRPSGGLWKVWKDGESQFFERYRSVEAARISIRASRDNRTYTRDEWLVVHGERTIIEIAIDMAMDAVAVAHADYETAASKSKLDRDASLYGDGWKGVDARVYELWRKYKAADLLQEAAFALKNAERPK